MAKSEVKVPQNSDASGDDIMIDSTSDEEQAVVVANGGAAEAKTVFNEDLIALNPFDMDKLIIFPHKSRDGEPPLKILKKPKPDYIFEV